jgi:hypothetical protein
MEEMGLPPLHTTKEGAPLGEEKCDTWKRWGCHLSTPPKRAPRVSNRGRWRGRVPPLKRWATLHENAPHFLKRGAPLPKEISTLNSSIKVLNLHSS